MREDVITLKKVIRWGQRIKTRTPSRFVSISAKVWQKAERFAPQIPAFFPCLAPQQLPRWAVEESKHPDSQLFSSPFEREPRAWHLASQTFRLLGDSPACWRKARETLGAAGSKYTNSERFGAPRRFRRPGAPRQPLTRPTGCEWGCRHTGTPCPPKQKTAPVPLSQRTLKGLGLVLYRGKKVGFFG